MEDWEKQMIDNLQRNFDRQQARLDRQHQQRLNRIQEQTNREIYNGWLKVLVDYIEADVKPSASMKRDVKKAGIDYNSLYEDASRRVYRGRVASIKEEMYKHRAKDATVLRDYVTTVFNWDADYCDRIVNGVLNSMTEDYRTLLDKRFAGSLTDEESTNLVIIMSMINKSIEDFKQDVINRKAELEEIRLEEEKKKKEEAERRKAQAEANRISKNKAAYKKILEEAIDKMEDNVDAGVAFITNYNDISVILSDVGVSMDECIAKAKICAEERRLQKLNDEINLLSSSVKSNYKSRNIVGYCGLGSFILGVMWFAPFFLYVGIGLFVITYIKHIKANKKRLQLGNLIAKRDGVEFDPSVNPYEHPFVLQLTNIIKKKK